VLRDEPGVEFVAAGSGPRLAELAAEAGRRGLARLRVIAPVDEGRVSELLSMGGLHVVALDPRATGTCVPSKTYAAMAVARPVAFLGSERSQSALDVTAAGAGRVLDPADGKGLAAFIEELRCDPAAGGYGRRALEFFLRERELSIAGRRWRQALSGA